MRDGEAEYSREPTSSRPTMASFQIRFISDILTFHRQGLIAINYPARKYGLNRHIDIAEAKKLCPNLICQHVATWKEGDEKWAYHENAAAHIATHKVSLDPYRLESRKILACVKESLPATLQKVEKASVDEVFLDLSAHVHSILLERYPELALPAPYDDQSEHLPPPPTTALDWQADALIDLDSTETEDDDPDWDDIAILIGSEIVRGVRQAIWEKLKYTCSGGIAHNKMLSKLGSAHEKPNKQTVIRNRAIKHFLLGFKFTKIRNLGGKLGDQVVAAFGTDTVKDLLEIPIEQLKQKLGDEAGSWVYQTVRGIDSNEVNPRTQIKSMLSAKSFRPSIQNFEQAVRWLRIFVSDIFSRLVEEGVLENKRRPKNIILHYKQNAGQTRSRSAPIPGGKTLDEQILFDLAKKLLSEGTAKGTLWPCANLSLAVSGFEDGITDNMGIGSFLVKGDAAKAMNLNGDGTRDSIRRPEKRRRLEGDSAGIQKFFTKQDSTVEHDDFEVPVTGEENIQNDEAPSGELSEQTNEDQSHLHSMAITICEHCQKRFYSEEARQSHSDWHFAKDLQDEDRKTSASHQPARPQPTPAATAKRQIGLTNKKSGRGGYSQTEKGQSRLSFG
jgi:DNA polymerase eta